MRGYDQDEVDGFLRVLAARLDNGADPAAEAARIAGVTRFSIVTLGYARSEVHEHLHELRLFLMRRAGQPIVGDVVEAPKLVAQPEPVMDAVVAELVMQAEPEPVMEAEPEPVMEAQPEPALEAEPEPVAEVVEEAPQPYRPMFSYGTSSQPAFEPAPVAEPEPEMEAEPEPMMEAEPEPVEEPEAQMVFEPAPEMVEMPVAEESVVEQPAPAEGGLGRTLGSFLKWRQRPEQPVAPVGAVEEEPGAVELDAEPVMEAEPEPVMEAEPEPVMEAARAGDEAEPEPVMEVESEPEPEPVMEAEPESEPVLEIEELVSAAPPEADMWSARVNPDPEPVMEAELEPVMEAEPT